MSFGQVGNHIRYCINTLTSRILFLDFFTKQTIGLKYIPRSSARYLQEMENLAMFGSFEPELVVDVNNNVRPVGAD
jgi:hypothetical protein